MNLNIDLALFSVKWRKHVSWLSYRNVGYEIIYVRMLCKLGYHASVNFSFAAFSVIYVLCKTEFCICLITKLELKLMTYTFYFAFASIWWVKGSHPDTKETQNFLNDRLNITVNKVTEHLLSYIISHSQQENDQMWYYLLMWIHSLNKSLLHL